MVARERVRRELRAGRLTETELLTAVPHIGAYLEGRLRRAFGAGATPLTLGEFWHRTRRRTTNGLLRLLHSALQNERANQCVSPRTRATAHRSDYHTGDVNEFGYEACVALLDHARLNARMPRVAYGALPARLPSRGAAAKHCACRSPDACGSGCSLATSGQRCVPTNRTARGFVGARKWTNQTEHARDVARVRRASRTRSVGNDPDAIADALAGRPRSLTYSRRGTRLWRDAGPRIRVPL